MEIKNKEHLETLYDIVRDTWELFQQDFEGDPVLELSSDNKDLTLLHSHLKSLVKLGPTIVYPYEINFHEKVMRILRNENECALERLKRIRHAKVMKYIQSIFNHAT
jgi:hypothetical protein